ncbi:DinB family protein [Lutimaribacter marinistellae]|uniref:DinB family protein n=1 Tax=Lutimaribacter marinistellae TaxID=1820329 RepID=A0ABV7THE1_9RHOB
MTGLQAEWDHMRGLTVDLLANCSPDDLQFSLHPQSGPLWKQFRHMGRVHAEYLAGLETGKMAFGTGAGRYTGGVTARELAGYLADLNAWHCRVMAQPDPPQLINWFGERVSRDLHMVRLIAHEALHHGQLMLFWRALGHSFPTSWESWGVA